VQKDISEGFFLMRFGFQVIVVELVYNLQRFMVYTKVVTQRLVTYVVETAIT
jgi:hypothetical protein